MQQSARLRRHGDFVVVQRRGRGGSNALLTLRALPNDADTSRFGFLISKRVGKAVVRNRARRRLREICRREPVAPGWDLVLIAKPAIVNAPFEAIVGSVRELFARARAYRQPAKTPAQRGATERPA